MSSSPGEQGQNEAGNVVWLQPCVYLHSISFNLEFETMDLVGNLQSAAFTLLFSLLGFIGNDRGGFLGAGRRGWQARGGGVLAALNAVVRVSYHAPSGHSGQSHPTSRIKQQMGVF